MLLLLELFTLIYREHLMKTEFEIALDSIQSSEFLLGSQNGCKILYRIKKKCKPCP